MDVLNFLVEHWMVFASLGSFGSAVLILWLSSRYMPRAECAEIQASCAKKQQELSESNADHAKRLDAEAVGLRHLEDILQTIPKIEALHALELSIASLEGRLNTIDVQIHAQGEMLSVVRVNTERVHNFLMEHGIGVK